jgi:hypothetical protein
MKWSKERREKFKQGVAAKKIARTDVFAPSMQYHVYFACGRIYAWLEHYADTCNVPSDQLIKLVIEELPKILRQFTREQRQVPVPLYLSRSINVRTKKKP